MTSLPTMWAEVNDTVTYDGDNREALRGRTGTVVAIRPNVAGQTENDSFTVKMDDSGELIYGARWSWQRVAKTITPGQRFDIDELFTEAAGGKLMVARNEILRLKARLAELEKFVEVYESL
jgi:hypothetical protein